MKKNVEFSALIEKFKKMGEKTGWTYIVFPAEFAQILFPGNKKSFRIKGTIDGIEFSALALLPMGEGEFILPLKADIRKAIGKKEGNTIHLKVERDKSEYQLDVDLVVCLEEEPFAAKAFYAMPKSHQNYYSKWIESAKTSPTKANRIAKTIHGMLNNLTFAETLRAK